MKPPALLGRIVYFFGYPIFRILIRGSTRAYVAVTLDDTILLTKNWLGFQKKWRLPGGGVHDGETPNNAAIRELKEEIGLSVDIINLKLLSDKPQRARFGYDYYLFSYEVKSAQKIKPDEREILAVKYVPKALLSSTILGEETTQAISLLGWF